MNMKSIKIIGDYWDLTFIIFYMALMGITLNVFPNSLIRASLGIPFVMFIPGYSMTAAFFPGKYPISGVDRVALSFGLSVAVLPILGVLIEYSPWRLAFLPMLLSLYSLIIVSCLVAFLSRKRLPKSERLKLPNIEQLKNELFIKPDTRINKSFYAIFFLLIGASIFLIVNSYISNVEESKLTEFYILDSAGSVGDLPRQLAVNKSTELTVGVINHESAFTTYELRIKIDDEMIGKESVELEDGGKWEKKISITPKTLGMNQSLEFLLLKKDAEVPYRQLRLIIDVVE